MRNLQVLFLFKHKDFQICISIPLKKPISTSIKNFLSCDLAFVKGSLQTTIFWKYAEFFNI